MKCSARPRAARRIMRWSGGEFNEGVVGRTLDLMLQTPLTICGDPVAGAPKSASTQRPWRGHARLSMRSRSPMHSNGSPVTCGLWRRSPSRATRGGASAPGNRERPRSRAATAARSMAQHPRAALEDVPNNTTRFWVLGRVRVPPSGRDETSLVMVGPKPTRARCTACSSRSLRHVSQHDAPGIATGEDRLWEYLFYVDGVGHETTRRGRSASGTEKKAQ